MSKQDFKLTDAQRQVREEVLEPEVKLEEGARMLMGQKSKPGMIRWVVRGVKWAGIATIAYGWYNRNTMLEGGTLCRSKKSVLPQDLKLMDWYFHLLGKNTGFITTFQFQCALPVGRTYDADELLTEFARGMMQSWPRRWEARERGLDEPLDAYTPEDVEKCAFRPPLGFTDQDVAAKVSEVAAEVELPWYKRLWDKAFATPAAPGVPTPEDLAAQGDVIGGYFVHRRAGQHTVQGTERHEEIKSARSMVLAPDPWEERAYVLSCVPGNGYCTFRLHYGTSRQSDYFPEEKGYLGELYRIFIIRKHRLMATASGNYVERKMSAAA